MKLLKRVSILAVLITVIAVFAGCGKEATVVGTWEGDDYTYTFNDDGTGIQQIGEISVSITSYEAKDGKLSITISFLGTEETDEYTQYKKYFLNNLIKRRICICMILLNIMERSL